MESRLLEELRRLGLVCLDDVLGSTTDKSILGRKKRVGSLHLLAPNLRATDSNLRENIGEKHSRRIDDAPL